jgi:hypothetical protein
MENSSEKPKKKCGCLAGGITGSVVKPFVLIHWEENGKHSCKCKKRVDLLMGLTNGRSIINQYNFKDKCQAAVKNCAEVKNKMEKNDH